MEEYETITKYYAVVKEGDEHHKAGEVCPIAEYQLDDVKKRGIRLKVSEDRWRTCYHYYPVYITKKVYRLDLIEVETLEGGNRDEYRKWGETIGRDYHDNETSDWKDRWP